MTKLGATVRVEGLPVTVEELRELKPFEFQNWVIRQVQGSAAPRKTGDMGINGYSFMEHLPIQVKRSDHVGRNVVDNFETAVKRNERNKGYIIAFSFTKGAYEEAARVKAADGIEIVLVTVEDLLDASEALAPVAPQTRIIRRTPTPDLMTLLSGWQRKAEEWSIAGPVPSRARPTADQLFESSRETAKIAG